MKLLVLGFNFLFFWNLTFTLSYTADSSHTCIDDHYDLEAQSVNKLSLCFLEQSYFYAETTADLPEPFMGRLGFENNIGIFYWNISEILPSEVENSIMTITISPIIETDSEESVQNSVPVYLYIKYYLHGNRTITNEWDYMDGIQLLKTDIASKYMGPSQEEKYSNFVHLPLIADLDFEWKENIFEIEFSSSTASKKDALKVQQIELKCNFMNGEYLFVDKIIIVQQASALKTEKLKDFCSLTPEGSGSSSTTQLSTITTTMETPTTESTSDPSTGSTNMDETTTGSTSESTVESTTETTTESSTESSTETIQQSSTTDTTFSTESTPQSTVESSTESTAETTEISAGHTTGNLMPSTSTLSSNAQVSKKAKLALVIILPLLTIVIIVIIIIYFVLKRNDSLITFDKKGHWFKFKNYFSSSVSEFALLEELSMSDANSRRSSVISNTNTKV